MIFSRNLVLIPGISVVLILLKVWTAVKLFIIPLQCDIISYPGIKINKPLVFKILSNFDYFLGSTFYAICYYTYKN